LRSAGACPGENKYLSAWISFSIIQYPYFCIWVSAFKDMDVSVTEPIVA
jgi:hypothetical protein